MWIIDEYFGVFEWRVLIKFCYLEVYREKFYLLFFSDMSLVWLFKIIWVVFLGFCVLK